MDDLEKRRQHNKMLTDRIQGMPISGQGGEDHPNYPLMKARDMQAEIDRLKGLLKHADDVVIWEHTAARAGFQEEIEAALGII